MRPTIVDAVRSLIPNPPAFYVSASGSITGWDTQEVATGIAQPTQSEIDAEVIRLQAEYDSQEYARNRKTEYNQLNQFEMQFDDDRDSTSTWVDKINEIKGRHPK